MVGSSQTGTDAGGALDGFFAAVLVLLFFALLCTPLVITVTGRKFGEPVHENRVLAAPPASPTTWKKAFGFPRALSDYLGDNYGLRDSLVRLDGQLRYRLFSDFISPRVVLGRKGRLFLNSHPGADLFSLIDHSCGVGVSDEETDRFAEEMARLLSEGESLARQVYYVGVPTTPIVYRTELPNWLRLRCDRAEPFTLRLARVMTAKDSALGARLLFPRAALEGAKTAGPPYPTWNFHWSGAGARAVAEAVAGGTMKFEKLKRLLEAWHPEISDMTGFTPGVLHTEVEPIPLPVPSGIDLCYGSRDACRSDLRPFSRAINEISQANWTSGHGPRLLIISDSFGRVVTPYFSEYFAEILQLNISLEKLRSDELTELGKVLLAQGRYDALLFIYHDAAVSYPNGLVSPVGVMAQAAKARDG